jgi:DNA topoisomerase-1
METITLDQALELFKLPREAGIFEDKPMVASVGKFGPYVRHDGKFYSLGKEDDPLSITEERAVAIIEAKRKADSEKLIKEFAENPDVKVLNGRYGPYIVAMGKNVKIPKGTEPADLTLDECLALAEQTPEKKGRFAPAASKAKPAAAAPKAKTTKAKAAATDEAPKKTVSRAKKK